MLPVLVVGGRDAGGGMGEGEGERVEKGEAKKAFVLEFGGEEVVDPISEDALNMTVNS